MLTHGSGCQRAWSGPVVLWSDLRGRKGGGPGTVPRLTAGDATTPGTGRQGGQRCSLGGGRPHGVALLRTGRRSYLTVTHGLCTFDQLWAPIGTGRCDQPRSDVGP